MKHNNCVCSIIPPHVIDVLTKNKVLSKKALKDSIKFSQDLRKKRASLSMDPRIRELASLSTVIGKAERVIYDSKHTSKARFVYVRREGDPPIADDAANKVFDNSGLVRDYYKTKFNWFSVDNKGKNLVMNIHYLQDFNNALWSSSDDQMYFGDGDGHTFKNIAQALDVIAHELTHGVVEYTAALEYEGQSGALNEHIADVFGTVIKQHYKNQQAATADWLIGDEIVGDSFPGNAIRSMKDPGHAYTGDDQPAHMRDLYTGTDDHGGVHANSGILNKAFFLVASGVDGVAGIDTELAGMLWFYALRAIKDPRCDFSNFKAVVSNSVTSLVGDGKLPNQAAALVSAAFGNVGL